MKKIRIIAIVLLLILVASVVIACNDRQDPTEVSDAYITLNALLGKVSYPFTVTTKLTEDGDIFYGTYQVAADDDKINIAFSYQKLSMFETEDGDLAAPEDYKKTVTGTVAIQDGKVVEQNGAKVNLSTEAFNVSGINLNESALTDIQIREGNFVAKASSLNALMGLDIVAENIKISIFYTAEEITELKLSFTTPSYKMEITYNFS